jgi:heat shock protein HslJ/predicted RecA/RadA family phage recombinase
LWSRAELARVAPGLFIAVLVLQSCAAARGPTLDELRNATITSLPGGAVSLRDGVFEAAPLQPGSPSRRRVVLSPQPLAVGHLAGVRGKSTVALFSISEGGTGNLVYVGIFRVQSGRATDMAGALVGDRVQVRTLGIVDGAVILDVVEAGPGDAMCCPGQLARKSYGFRDGTLRLASSSVTGRLSLAALADATWTLVSLDRLPISGVDRPPTAVIEGSRLSGFGGCNRYTGQVAEKSPGDIVVGPLAATKMACPAPAMELESRFLAAMSRMTRYSFVDGRLVLSTIEGGAPQELMFERDAR